MGVTLMDDRGDEVLGPLNIESLLGSTAMKGSEGHNNLFARGVLGSRYDPATTGFTFSKNSFGGR